MTKNAILALACLATFTLTACDTVQRDVNNSFSNSATALQQAFSNLRALPPEPAAQPVQDTALALNNAPIIATAGSASISTTGPNCPNVRIVNDLNQVHQFADSSGASHANEISSVQMQGVDTKCQLVKNSISIDMNIAFTGEVGPKGRARNGDKPSFAYPYFVAITNNQGSIIGKEVFALSMDYNGGNTSQTRTEQVRQLIPVKDKDYRNYKVMIGFQLSDQELAYNRAMPPEYMSPSNPIGEIEPASGGSIKSAIGND